MKNSAPAAYKPGDQVLSGQMYGSAFGTIIRRVPHLSHHYDVVFSRSHERLPQVSYSHEAQLSYEQLVPYSPPCRPAKTRVSGTIQAVGDVVLALSVFVFLVGMVVFLMAFIANA